VERRALAMLALSADCQLKKGKAAGIVTCGKACMKIEGTLYWQGAS